jgi:signal transduction histidine kinase
MNIEDNGVGFDVKNEYEGNGLRNMQNRMHSINGSINIECVPGSGTKIKIQVPLESILKT